MVKVIKAKIRMKTSITNFRIWAVDNEGFYSGTLPYVYEDGCIVFETGGEFASMYYLIQAQ